MANTYNKFQLKRTSVSGRTPNTTNSANSTFLDTAELALNLTDKKLFSSNGSSLFEIGSNLSSLSVSGTIVANTLSVTSGFDANTVGGNSASDLRTYAANAAANAYSNAVSIAASDATTKAGTAYSNAISYANTAAGTAYSNAISYANTAAGTAYSNAIATASSDATTKAGTAYSNAIAYSANASNITSGTLNTARLPANVSISGLANSGFANVTNTLWVGGNTTIGGTLTVTGNLTLNGNTTIVGANNLIVQDAVISLHTQANLAPWTTNDNKLIGLAYHYYDTADKQALLSMNSSNTYLTYYNTSTDAALGDPSGTTLGTIQANTFVAGNTTQYSQLTPTTLVIGNTTVGTVNAITINIAGNTALGNTTVTGFANVSTTLNVVGAATVNGALTVNNTAALGNTTVTGFINSSSYGTFAGTVNAASINVGANVNISTTQINVGNTTVNTVITSTGITSNAALTIGNTTINGTLTATGQTSLGGAVGAEGLRVTTTASAVNYVQATGAATGNRPIISVQGSDGNVGLTYNAKGSANHFFQTGGLNSFAITNIASQVNYLQAAPSVAGFGLQFSAQGSDTNISQVFQPKGTGAIDLAAGSSGVNISNGGTVTAITRTASGGPNYTTIPTCTISAPTTAGGVQATASVPMFLSLATVSAGGSGYLVGDTITLVGGTGSAAILTVATLSGSAVATVTITNAGNYTALPTNPVSTTGGTGTGATFTCGYGIGTPTITAAGSGYVEQPTITFSSGSAAAYATVGAGTIVKSIGSTMSFYTPGGEGFRVVDSGVTNAAYWAAYGASGTPDLRSSGPGTISSTGANTLSLRTNTSTVQAVVAHTASAVNYVQVTGATTASKVVAISAQGSDTDVTLSLSPKGAGTIRFGTYTGTILTPTGYITITDSGGTSRRLLVG